MEQAVLPLLEAVPPGLDFAGDVMTDSEEAALVAAIDGLDLPHFVFQGWTRHRRTRSFGFAYDFTASNFATSEPIPDFLAPLKQRAAGFAGVSEHSLVQASVIRYDPGAGIGWHKDRPELGTVVGFSLGAAATMRFRRKTDTGYQRAAKHLPPRSIYHLAGAVRYEWEHSIPPGAGLRWSVTFRGITDLGRIRMGSADR